MVYLDHNATTPLDARVLEAMLPYLTSYYGNPSSTHPVGRAVRQALETARAQEAALVRAQPDQVIFTSGGTEANHLALIGALQHQPSARLALSAIEHASVRTPARLLADTGWQVDVIPVDTACRITGDYPYQADTRLVSVMWANNETGTVQDIRALTRRAHTAGAWVHTDAVQAVGKLAVDFAASGVQFMTLAAHKMGGPKGVGALIVEQAGQLRPVVQGGSQERGLRGGTENVAGIVGFGAAAEFARTELEQRGAGMRALRDRLEAGLRTLGIVAYAAEVERLPNTVLISVPTFAGEALLEKLGQTGYALSSGSACSSIAPSHVLAAMGVARAAMRNVLRVSLGVGNTEADIDGFVASLAALIGAQRTWPAQSVA
jgi:cysteine desulfurase